MSARNQTLNLRIKIRVWLSADNSKKINELELHACFFGLEKSITVDRRNLTVIVYLDNMAAVQYINKQGDTRSNSLCAVAIEIITWCEPRGFSIEANYLPGALNIEADQVSQAVPDASDWRL